MAYDIENRAGQLVIGQKAIDLMKQFQEWEVEAQERKNIMEDFRNALMDAMEKTGNKKWEIDTDEVSAVVTYVESQIRKTVDTNALKEDGLYDAYTKETVTKPQVRIRWR